MPGVANEVVPESLPRAPRFHLWSALLIAVSAGFVTALISLTGELQTYWPLYLAPIVIASLAYHVGGAVVASALATALIALLMPESSSLASLPQLVVGMVAFLLSGIVIGAQARRQRQHGQMLEQASIRDQLTGLYKPDYLHNRLAEEIRRADRYDVPTSLALVAVDAFADFKERYGHYKADLMLEHMADLLRISVRDTDIVARYGPTEFAVVLPFTPSASAELVADRIRRTVSEAEFEGDVLDPVTKMTVSVAVAGYPEDASGQDELVALVTRRVGGHQIATAEPTSGTLSALREVPS